jgi:predicted alpha/beta-fold hydrolase
MEGYRAPPWLPGGNAQTIWPALFARRFEGAAPVFRRERWATPDGDFIDVDWSAHDAAPTSPLLVLFHGLEGSSQSHYAQAFAHRARHEGWRYAVPHFRGCSGELNLAPRAYHSGDYEEIGWMLDGLRARHAGPIVAVGVSLTVRAVAAVCSPIDLAAGGRAIGRGFNRLVYTRMFLRTMIPKALRKLAQHPGLFDRDRLLAARDLYEFDDVFTAPLHGFAGTDDYWRRGSAKPHLHRIRIPALVLNARNDPFIPADCLPAPHEVRPPVTLWQPAHGGHVGFPAGRFPGHVLALPQGVMAWMKACL